MTKINLLTQEQIDKMIEEAKISWSEVADKHNWSMKNRGVTVWINSDFTVADSVYNAPNVPNSFIVNYDTEALIHEQKG